jgi:glyoxylase-like metal-dependent hydrolase (beta-lactamase superfamily II)
MQSWKVGNVTITKVLELEAPGMNFLLPDAIPENLKNIPWLMPHFVTESWKAVGSIHTLIVESQGQRILVDTCLGNDKKLALPIWSDRSGPFLQDITDAGYPKDSIDTVLCTHLHPDHVGWNTMLADGKWIPTFENAKYLFGRTEWDHFSNLEDKNSRTILEQSVQPIVDADLHTLVETDHKLTDEIWLEPTPGHTPGHVSVRIKSEGKEAVITGDCMHHPCQMVHPEWKCVADHDSTVAETTRRNFLNRYADTPTLVIGTHFATVTAGHIVSKGDSYRFEV